MKKLLFFLLITSFSFAQNIDRNFISGYWTDEEFPVFTYKIKVSDGEYYFRFYNESVIETTFVPTNEKPNTTSHAVVLKDTNVEKIFLEDDKKIRLETKNITVEIQKSPFKISYFHKDKLILSEKAGYLKRKHIPLEYVQGNIKADSTEVLQFNISADEILYGSGARALGMNRRGHKLPLYNRAHYGYETHSSLMNFCMPLVISSNMYAVHFDNPAVGYLDFDSQKNNTLEYETISGRKTYQVIVGDTWEDLISNYTGLTGKQPLPPRWALGNFSSRFGYHSEAETRKTIQKFRDENIPVDAVILDLYWFGKEVQGTMGNLEVFRDSFPNFEKMVADFNKTGVKTILITEPFILTTSKKWQETADRKILATFSDGSPATWDFYFGNTGIIDIFKPEGKEWFWNIYKGLADKGVGGVWGDLGEPEVFPAEAQTAGGKAGEVHNVYGHNWAKLIHEGYQKDFPNQRPFILMRAGYSGSQRFGMIPWSGDVNRTWGGLQSQPEIALQMGMQGMAYMHSDLGGFAGANLDDELYVRWLQYGVFQPVFRPHAQSDVPSEPVFRSDWAKKHAKEAIELRYRLLPYNYTLAFENATSGVPLMRPLFFEEPDNKNLLTKSDGYLWGNNFLVYPVTEKGQKTKEVYFPKASGWYDFYTGKKYHGGTTHTVSLHENHIPVFVRAGSFIPMYRTAQSTETVDYNTIDLHYYHENGVSSDSQSLYEDDGKSPDSFDNDKCNFLHFESGFSENKLQIKVFNNTAMYYKAEPKTVNFIIHNIEKKPKKVILDNKKERFEYNKKTKTVTFRKKQSQDYDIITVIKL